MHNNQFFIIKNEESLLENLYGFVQYDVESPFSFIEKFNENYNTSLNIVAYIDTVKHVFTHKTWHMNIYHFMLNQPLNNMYTLE